MAPIVHLYTLCWNEADMLGFFFRHYDDWVSRYVVYDDGSTDGSLDILRAHPKVELRRFERVVSASFVLSHKVLHNEAWKESRRLADWVVVTAIDEHLLVRGRSMSDYLARQKDEGVTLIPALGFDMNSRTMPEDRDLLVDMLTRGCPTDGFNKLGIFDPAAVRETGFGAGRHNADPAGDLRLPEHDELMLWHYKYMGFERTSVRQAELGRRLGSRDVERRYGKQYLWSAAQFASVWNQMEAHARDLAAADFDPGRDGAPRRWWQLRPDITRVGDDHPRSTG